MIFEGYHTIWKQQGQNPKFPNSVITDKVVSLYLSITVSVITWVIRTMVIGITLLSSLHSINGNIIMTTVSLPTSLINQW